MFLVFAIYFVNLLPNILEFDRSKLKKFLIFWDLIQVFYIVFWQDYHFNLHFALNRMRNQKRNLRPNQRPQRRGHHLLEQNENQKVAKKGMMTKKMMKMQLEMRLNFPVLLYAIHWIMKEICIWQAHPMIWKYVHSLFLIQPEKLFTICWVQLF